MRQGFEALLRPLKEAARKKKIGIDIVPCGGRIKAHEKFLDKHLNAPEQSSLLLVDSEEAVSRSPIEHLHWRDQWEFPGVGVEAVHLMIQVMETWIVADPEALQAFYRDGFQASALPRHTNLEAVSKSDIQNALERAKRNTQPRTYHKTRHSGKLIAKLSHDKVRQRCPSFDRLLRTIQDLIDTYA